MGRGAVAADPANARIDDPPMHPDEKAARPDDSTGAARGPTTTPARSDDSINAASTRSGAPSTTPPARPRPDGPA
jgi:hypothetical protein